MRENMKMLMNSILDRQFEGDGKLSLDNEE